MSGRHTYLDELRERAPDRVNSLYIGGADGCPGDHFFGAAAYDPTTCSPIKDQRCRACWEETYAQERYAPDDEE